MNSKGLDDKAPYYLRKIGTTRIRGPESLSKIIEVLGGDQNHSEYEIALAEGQDSSSLLNQETWINLKQFIKPKLLDRFDENFRPDKILLQQPNNALAVDLTTSSFMGGLGAFILLAGLLLTIFFIVFETSVDGEYRNVVNLDLVQNRIIGMMTGLATTLVGIFLISTAIIVRSLQSIVLAINKQP